MSYGVYGEGRVVTATWSAAGTDSDVAELTMWKIPVMLVSDSNWQPATVSFKLVDDNGEFPVTDEGVLYSVSLDPDQACILDALVTYALAYAPRFRIVSSVSQNAGQKLRVVWQTWRP